MMENATALSLIRMAAGAGAWATPTLSLRVIGLDERPQAAYLMRLFGVRDLALGVITLLAGPEHRRAVLALGALVDASDAASSALALRRGVVGRAAGVALAGTATAAVVVGVTAARRPSPTGRRS
jgi:hypothetical protein